MIFGSESNLYSRLMLCTLTVPVQGNTINASNIHAGKQAKTHTLTIKSEVYKAFVNPEESFREGLVLRVYIISYIYASFRN